MAGRNYFISIIIVSILASCSATKKVPPGDALYMGATVDLEAPGSRPSLKKELRRELISLTRPKPNQRVLGIPFKLLFNNNKLLRKKMGEPPVLLSSVNVDYNVKVLRSNLENRGYFQAQVQGDTTVKRKRGRAIYTVQAGERYFISKVEYIQDTSAVLQRTINESSAKTFLKAGDPFDLAVIKGERERIDAYLKERGFYYFDPDFLIIQADSTVGGHKVDLYVKIKPETPVQSREVYTINDVFIYPRYRLRPTAGDTSKAYAEFYAGYYLVDSQKLYKPKLFERTMQFDPGDVYNRTDHGQTISRLVNLDLFKFVKNRFEPVPGIDSSKLNAYYYLTPFPKKAIRGEINANTKSNNLTGSSITIGWRNRNTLRGGELFTVDATGGFEVQAGSQFRGFNTFRYGIEANFVVPRFIFLKLNPKGGFVPKTKFLLGYDLLTKQKLYTMQSFRAGLGYNWQQTFQKEHQFNFISINYVQPLLITDLYKDSAAKNRTLLKAIEDQFILGTNYNYNYNQLQGKPAMSGGLYFNGNVDLSGNVAGLLSGADAKNGKVKEIFKAPFSQYIRLEADNRYYSKLSKTTVWANRLILGFGLPYGNSMQLPYIKQFFVGGTNSIRAFRSRSIGPGTYRDTVITTFLPDQSGDIKLELNTELRQKLSGFLHGALFVDAGNIWLYNDEPLKPGAKFTGKFLKEMAVGGGVGLRFDISFLVVRLDVAIPFRKPWLPAGKRWVFNQFDFSNSAWRKENIIFNLGIGYPF
ncbi:translocation and assembly module lipoprotein TamL [Terrimonas pollutisoli]|uniref:translocation and assembly module lipoprotein TamL n=1 Tax=Terrimonas pollutisoli TaxID=3034147 RepID=UPI0023EC04B4|nr:BamA/TamA family outer membrane protein [Terrimonas sp. H1YJ31]